MSVTTKKWVLNTVEKLSTTDLEELKQYLEYLVWKSEIPIESLGNPQGSSKIKRKGQPKRILAAINKSHDVTPEDAEALLNAIKEGEIPMRFDSVFDESVSVTSVG
ncbi:MAG: hypothetical protein OXU27_03440 [Candidatus Poribacteria bacterium]|nr:hypothetical protein [Candidatus Poribacteria bacterium]